MNQHPGIVPGTIVWLAPFYNRSGFGIAARTLVSTLHRAGARIRIIALDQVEQGIDDCDLALIKSLESTPVVPPVTAIVSHVPSKAILEFKWPEPHVLILATTVFDCCADNESLPVEMLRVCRAMDQVWLSSQQELDRFVSVGFPKEMLRTVHSPHPWLENPVLPPPCINRRAEDRAFRFTNISLFLPRRRWDTLIEAYLEEFKEEGNVELYLKVNYPGWHPVPGRPRQELFDLVESLRRKTGSGASIIIDEDMGTRMGILELMDKTDVYISTDTAATAPVGEAFVRRRLVVMPVGLGLVPDEFYVPIEVDPTAVCPITPEMLLYQPNHRGSTMPLLHVRDVRGAMRRAYTMDMEEQRAKIEGAAKCVTPPVEAAKMAAEAIVTAWQNKQSPRRPVRDTEPNAGGVKVCWEGAQLVAHSLALVNRELCLQLIDRGCDISILPGAEAENISPDSDRRFGKIVGRKGKPFFGTTDVHVRHQWPPDFNPPFEGRWVMIQPWEYGRLPESWVEPMATLLDEIWVPSRHVFKTCIASGVPADCVRVVPNGVNRDLFAPEALPCKLPTDKKFKFLFVGGTIWRKGIDLLLEAYRRSFRRGDDVCLVIKDMGTDTFYRGQGAREVIRRIQSDPSAPEIAYFNGNLEEHEMPSLFTACDCLVHPYRAEGFGLPVLEAMACGIPVITTEGGSTDDFCPPDSVYLVPARRMELVLQDIRLACGAGWVLDPDLNALCEQMRKVREDGEAARQRALGLSHNVRAEYNWKNVAGLVGARLHALARKPIKREAGA